MLERPDPRTTSVIAGTRLDLLEAMETIERDHPQYVEPLLLRDVYGMSYEEIAAADRRPARARSRHRSITVGSWPARCCAATNSRRHEIRGLVAAVAAASLLARRLLVRRRRRATQRRPRPPARPSARDAERGAADPDDPALDAAAQRAGRGPRLPRRRRPGRGRPALPARPRLDAGVAAPSRASRPWSSAPPTDADQFQLDFGEPLTVGELTVDGEAAGLRGGRQGPRRRAPGRGRPALRPRDPLLRHAASRCPRPPPAPTSTRSAGRSPTADETWTMQEPYGAFTWYAVNDQPSDKALYDFTISTPAPWVGVANGELLSREELDGDTVTEWHLDEPASSYLVTVAVGDFRMTGDRVGERGPDHLLDRARRRPRARPGAERRRPARLDRGRGSGRTPSPRSGILVVDSMSGMETQTMVTLGNNDYILSPAVILHEMVAPVVRRPGDAARLARPLDVGGHGDVPPGDLGVRARASRSGTRLDDWAAEDQEIRDESGPPADYDPATFGETNVYFIPALMWDQLRERIGDDRVLGAGPRAGRRSTTTATRRTTRSPAGGPSRPARTCSRSSTTGCWARQTPDRS